MKYNNNNNNNKLKQTSTSAIGMFSFQLRSKGKATETSLLIFSDRNDMIFTRTICGVNNFTQLAIYFVM